MLTCNTKHKGVKRNLPMRTSHAFYFTNGTASLSLLTAVCDGTPKVCARYYGTPYPNMQRKTQPRPQSSLLDLATMYLPWVRTNIWSAVRGVDHITTVHLVSHWLRRGILACLFVCKFRYTCVSSGQLYKRIQACTMNWNVICIEKRERKVCVRSLGSCSSRGQN